MYIWAQKLIPQHLISRMVGKLANIQITWLKNKMITWFIKRYRVDLSEALIEDPGAYPSFNAFFTRALKPEARPLPTPTDTTAIISPVDGTVSELGFIKEQTLLQAKGHQYDLSTLLGGHQHRVGPFKNGAFFTAYLAPKDYHRVHLPFAGTLESMVHIPGTLFSVNPYTVDNVPQLFSKNERVVCYFRTLHGPMAVIMVGAVIVASVTTRWHGTVTPPTNTALQVWDYTDNPKHFTRGSEMGHFELGSTVIVLLSQQPSPMTWASEVTAGQPLCLGQTIGRFRPENTSV